ncbi:MAG: hypothetical protein CL666_14690 [Balneola sp.]|nr:hypothetical protein [Balneola sp.]|tara:strand:+ start:7073 stop:7420 length:348 start_codon:yes stop_codon:yes gene_type:complete
MSYFMDPGEMDRHLTVEKKTTSTNDYNEEVESWGTDGTIWARKTDQHGDEEKEGGQIVATGRTKWTIYFYPGLNARDYRFKDEYGNLFDIIGEPMEKGFREFMEVETVRRDNGTA